MIYSTLSDQPFSQLLGVTTVRMHTQIEGLQSLGKYPGVEGAHARSSRSQETKQCVAHRLITDHRPTDTTPLAIKKLCGRVHDDVCTIRKWALQRRCTVHIIDD